MAAREDLVVCPYDPAHMIRRTRMAYHLIKCKEQHPGVELAVCPYNATHQFPVEQEKVKIDLPNTRWNLLDNAICTSPIAVK